MMKERRMSSLSEKIDHLFETHTWPDGSPYNHKDVERGTDGAIDSAYLWRLRNGKAKNPGYKILAALSRFFDVPVAYFYQEEDEARYLHELELGRTLRDQPEVGEIALRLADLDEEARRDVASMIEYVRQARGLKGRKEAPE
jgi:transcriptional regulator with XRE-family HTH domain